MSQLKKISMQIAGFIFALMFVKVQATPQIALSHTEKTWLDTNPKLILGVDDRYPPFNYRGNDGEMRGITLDYLHLIEKKLDRRFKLEAAPWKEVFPKAMRHEIDGILNIHSTPKRQKSLIFTEGYRKLAYFAVMISKQAPSFTQLSDLEGQRLGVKRNTFQAEYVRKQQLNIELVEFETTDEGLLALTQGTVDGVFEDLPVLQHKVQQMLLSGVKLGWAQQVTGKEMAFGIGVRRNAPILATILDKAIRSISEAEHKQILDNWSATPFILPIFLSAKERAWLQAHPNIRLASNRHLPPFEMFHAGSYQGIAADYMQLLQQRLGLSFQTSPQKPWSDIVAMVEKRELDLFSSIRATAARQQFTSFTQPYLSHPMMIITDDNVSFVHGLKGLQGKIVAIEGDYIGDKLVGTLAQQLQIQAYPDTLSAMLAVSKGEAFAYIGDMAIMSYIVRHHGITNLKVSGELPYRFEISLGVRSDWEEFVPILQKALDSITEQEKNTLLQKHFSLKPPTYTDYSLLWYISSMLILVIILILYWNRKLAHSRSILQDSQDFIYTAINAIPEHLCVLDKNGTILMVNQAWQHFADTNAPSAPNCGIGVNYLDICDKATGATAKEAPLFAAGLRAVMSGQQDTFSLEYAYDTPTEKHWFIGRVYLFPNNEDTGRLLVIHENITANKTTTLALAEREALFSSLIEQSHESVSLSNKHGDYILVNPAFAKLSAYSQTELLSMRLPDVLPEAEKDHFRSKDNTSSPIDSYLKRKDGRICEVEISSTRIYLGKEGCSLNVVRDISERKQAERSLLAAKKCAENSLRERNIILNNAAVMIAFVIHRRFVWINDHMLNVFAYKREDILGQSVRLIYANQQDFEQATKDSQTILSRGESYQAEFCYQRKDGRKFWCQISTKAVDPSTPDKGVIYIFTDINKRVQIEHALRDSQLKYQHLIGDIAPSFSLYTHSAEGVLEYISQGAENIFAIPPDKAIGQNFFQLVEWLPESLSLLSKNVQTMLQTGKRQPQYELQFRRADQSIATILLSPHPVVDADGVCRKISGVVEDNNAE